MKGSLTPSDVKAVKDVSHNIINIVALLCFDLPLTTLPLKGLPPLPDRPEGLQPSVSAEQTQAAEPNLP